jgi:hypothetical protein
MQAISIRDDIEIDVGTGKPWKLVCDMEGIPCDETNLAWKAAKVFCEAMNKEPDGLEIRITKRIPSGAGMGGGSADAAALKAAKLTISGAVPVVGGILSDASEAVLVSTPLVKNTAGIYGILAILALCMGPFLKIGAHYLMLKLTHAVTATIGSKELNSLIGGFSTAMGLLLAMTGSVCLLLLISTVCFMKGIL